MLNFEIQIYFKTQQIFSIHTHRIIHFDILVFMYNVLYTHEFIRSIYIRYVPLCLIIPLFIYLLSKYFFVLLMIF